MIRGGLFFQVTLPFAFISLLTNLYNKEVSGRRSSVVCEEDRLRVLPPLSFFCFSLWHKTDDTRHKFLQTAQLLSLSGNPGTLRPWIFFIFWIFRGYPGAVRIISVRSCCPAVLSAHLYGVYVFCINHHTVHRQSRLLRYKWVSSGNLSVFSPDSVRTLSWFCQDSVRIRQGSRHEFITGSASSESALKKFVYGVF